MQEKKCTGCQTVKPVSEFSKWSRGKDGYQNYCKICNRKYLKKFNVDYLPARRNGDQSKTGSYLHHIWLKMIDRCTNPESSHFQYYGGRGITVCDRWLDWEWFKEDMLETYEIGLSLERVDVNWNYCPENCKWIPKSDQGLNKQDSLRITIDGQLFGLAEYCKKVGFNSETAAARYHRFGDDFEEIFKPYDPRVVYEDDVKYLLACNIDLPTKDLQAMVQESFGVELTTQYIKQVRHEWKRNKPISVLAKLFGPYEDFAV